ncbi:MAG: acyl-CoA reductase [Candidatus Thermoplasmatota archaeon]|nr:acyl-CoA reductase [Candidatus Thermoplasmatota archaeon]
MIKSYLLDGEFKERTFDDFTEISEIVNANRKNIYGLKLDIIIEFLTKLGRKIIRDKTINTIDGVSYISLWLRKDDLEKICRLNYLDQRYFENFEKTENNFELCAQPRGIVCHWVAGNIPTLAFFSLIQSILSKNGSIVKVPEENKDIILTILKHLYEIKVEVDGKAYYGEDIVSSISIVSFDGKNYENSKNFSLIADCKIIWGGYDAVSAVTALPQKEHCEIISFGPKYSFGVFDREYIESEYFEKAIENSVMDIAIFNQMACSSPHVFFFEKNKYSLKEIAQKMEFYFEKLPDKLLKQITPQGTAGEIINKRGMHLLEDDKEILKSNDLSWTILINKDITLEEPVQGKCIFLKEIDNVDEVLDLITRKIQAMGVCILNPEKRRGFAKEATYNGVDRIVIPGKMHDFDLPWDGILILNRLVRWVILKGDRNAK